MSDWTTAKIGALENGADSDAYDDLEKDVLRFTDEIVKSDSVSDELFHRLQEKLSPGALVELHLAVGFYIMTSKFLVTFGVDLQNKIPLCPNTNIFWSITRTVSRLSHSTARKYSTR